MDMVVAAAPSALSPDDERTALSKDALKRAFLDNLFYMQGKFPALATKRDYYLALAYVVRDRLLQRWVSTAAEYTKQRSRTVAYLSAEFLIGPHLGNNLVNLGIYHEVKQAVAELGLDFDDLLHQEEEPGLGNGGLGRLAACFLDSMATLRDPVAGLRHPLRVRHLRAGDRRRLAGGAHRQVAALRHALGHRAAGVGGGGEARRPHRDATPTSTAVTACAGCPSAWSSASPTTRRSSATATNTANTLRLWRAEAPESFDFAVFNRGDYYGAVNKKIVSENITKVLYPNDEAIQGKELRLEQQFFFVSCSLQDMLRIMRGQKIPLERFHEKFAVQLNDTHPADRRAPS